jgi:hypothetical protein
VVALVLGFVASRVRSTTPSPARVAVAVSTGEAAVVQVGIGGRRHSYLVPPQTVVALPDGEHGRIEIRDEACRLLGAVDQARAVPWQVVLVTPAGVSLELPTGTPPPLPDAEATQACSP